MKEQMAICVYIGNFTGSKRKEKKEKKKKRKDRGKNVQSSLKQL